MASLQMHPVMVLGTEGTPSTSVTTDQSKVVTFNKDVLPVAAGASAAFPHMRLLSHTGIKFPPPHRFRVEEATIDP
jgi:hypothetical protein